ncbi:hypothetical protein HDV00_005848 [Rhizophlyctis rosea]|nr:hypothetical protein HDV00_005848 [Rhizophlyctis rosea]
MFPPACPPILYGMENWRELAMNVGAWDNGWEGKRGMNFVEEAVERGPVRRFFEREGRRFMSELVDVVDMMKMTGKSGVLGAFPDGRVIAEGNAGTAAQSRRRALNEGSSEGGGSLEVGRITTVFDDAEKGGEKFESVPLPDLQSGSMYHRPTTAALCKKPTTSRNDIPLYYLFPISPSPTITNSSTPPPPTRYAEVPPRLHFSNKLNTVGSTTILSTDHHRTTVVLSLPPAPNLRLPIHAHPLTSHTESLLLHPTETEQTCCLTLYQLHPFKQLAQHTEDTYYRNLREIYLTRGHAILGFANRTESEPTYCAYKLRDLERIAHSIPVPKNISGLRTLNDGTLVAGRVHAPPLLFDALRKAWILLGGFDEDSERFDGYIIKVREYEVDGGGKRTARPPVVRYFYRTEAPR